jgi:hypothetical protein
MDVNRCCRVSRFRSVPSEAVTIDGETRSYAGRFFCRRCGSSVFARSVGETD